MIGHVGHVHITFFHYSSPDGRFESNQVAHNGGLKGYCNAYLESVDIVMVRATLDVSLILRQCTAARLRADGFL